MTLDINFVELAEEQDQFEELFMMAFEELEDASEDAEEFMDIIIDDISYLASEDISDILSHLDEKVAVADAIKAKKKKRKRDRTAAGKMAKRKLKIKLSKSSYRPNKKRSRKAMKGARIRRNIPG